MSLESVKQISERASDSIRAAKHYIGEVKDSALDRARYSARHVDDYTHEHAWKAVGISAVAGFVIGWLLGRNSD